MGNDEHPRHHSQKATEFLRDDRKIAGLSGLQRFLAGHAVREMMVAINPVWAEIIHREMLNRRCARADLETRQPQANYLTAKHREQLEKPIAINGRVYVSVDDDVLSSRLLHGGTRHRLPQLRQLLRTQAILPDPNRSNAHHTLNLAMTEKLLIMRFFPPLADRASNDPNINSTRT
jgi:hypothetical protein